MKPFRERNPIPIGIVGLTVLGLVLLAAFTIQDLPIVGGGTTYTALFSEAGGLVPGDEVRVAGVKVGRVTGVSLEDSDVVVSFQVGNAWIGDRSAAAIEIKTLLGQKYLAVDPVGDAPLDPRQPIPRSRTQAPYDVIQAFSGLAATVGDINTDQLAQSFQTLSNALRGAPQDVRGALSGLSRLSTTISARDAALTALLANTRSVTQVLADRDAEVRKLISDGNLLLAEVRIREQAIDTLLRNTQALAVQLRGLVNDNNAQLKPALDALDGVLTVLARNQANLSHGMALLAPFVRLFTNTLGNGRWFDTYIVDLLPPALGTPVPPAPGAGTPVPPAPGAGTPGGGG